MENNNFIKAMTMGKGSFGVETENGAISYGSLGTNLLDQFGKAGTNRGRDINDVFADQAALWNENAEMALKFPFYLRMITRQTNLFDGEKTEKVQKGQGARDESFKRLLWIEKFHPEKYYQNLWLVPIVGSWKDIWVLLSMSKNPNKTEYFKVLAEGINDVNHKDLVKKYMPRIRSNNACTTEWAKKTNQMAKEFAKFAGWSYEEYRLFKSTGKAHMFQKYICNGLYSKIDWNTIPGKALLNLVSGKFLKNHGLEESFENWLDKQPVAKFNGYVYEFAKKLRNCYGLSSVDKITMKTIDKQFANLIETAKKDNGGIKGNVWVALDTSGSMTCKVADGKTSAMDICMSLGVFFSTLNQGAFHKNVIMFDNKSTVKQLNGSFTDMMSQVPMDAMGGTNFQSVVEEICRIRRERPNIPLTDYPSTLLIVSDMQFNPVESRYNWDKRCYERTETNFEAMKRKLYEVFPQDFVDSMKFIWWNVHSRNNDYPTRLEDGGSYMLSGFDGSVVNLILQGEEKEKAVKTPKTMEELIEAALTQEILLQVKLS